jgi:hypothetical protein
MVPTGKLGFEPTVAIARKPLISVTFVRVTDSYVSVVTLYVNPMPIRHLDRTMQTNSPMIMEIVRFNAVAGTSDAALNHAATEGRDWLARQPGFIGRHLCREGEGYIDLVTWADMESAQSAASLVMSEPSFRGFMALIDGPSVRMNHLPILAAMP